MNTLDKILKIQNKVVNAIFENGKGEETHSEDLIKTYQTQPDQIRNLQLIDISDQMVS